MAPQGLWARCKLVDFCEAQTGPVGPVCQLGATKPAGSDPVRRLPLLGMASTYRNIRKTKCVNQPNAMPCRGHNVGILLGLCSQTFLSAASKTLVTLLRSYLAGVC